MRIVITTLAFGMRIQIPDIDLVIHWGPSDNILMYWQEVGRRARDGRPNKTKLCLPPYVLADTNISSNMRQFCQSGKCLRKVILKTLQLEGISEVKLIQYVGIQCCTYCNDLTNK